MPEIGDTLFVVVARDAKGNEQLVSLHVTLVAANRKADEVQREGVPAHVVASPVPLVLEV